MLLSENLALVLHMYDVLPGLCSSVIYDMRLAGRIVRLFILPDARPLSLQPGWLRCRLIWHTCSYARLETIQLYDQGTYNTYMKQPGENAVILFRLNDKLAGSFI